MPGWVKPTRRSRLNRWLILAVAVFVVLWIAGSVMLRMREPTDAERREALADMIVARVEHRDDALADMMVERIEESCPRHTPDPGD